MSPAFTLSRSTGPIWRRVRLNPRALYACAVLVVFGFVTNRLNVSVTGMEANAGVGYVPRWTEIAVTLAIIAAGFAVFRVAAKYLPIFEPNGVEERPGEREAVAGLPAPQHPVDVAGRPHHDSVEADDLIVLIQAGTMNGRPQRSRTAQAHAATADGECDVAQPGPPRAPAT